MIFKDKNGRIVDKIEDADMFELTIFDENGDVVSIQFGNIMDNGINQETNTLDIDMEFQSSPPTPQNLDNETKQIIGSLEDNIMKILKKTDYFNERP